MSTDATDAIHANIKAKEEEERTCRTCHQKFLSSINTPKSCVFHAEFYSGETAQRWMDPGETKGASVIHNFYSCCGGSKDSPGCCKRRHMTYDEPEDVSFRKPGMGHIS